MFQAADNHKPNDPRDYCRTCGHAEVRHTGKTLECGWTSPVLTEVNVEAFCACFKFVPSDNLEYLEMKVKEKEEEKLHL